MAQHLHIERPLDSFNLKPSSFGTESVTDVRMLASKLAHEINNPLDAVLRYINLAIRLLDDQHSDRPREYLLRSRQGLLYMSSLVKTWSVNKEQEQADPQRLSLGQILDQAIQMSLTDQERESVQINRYIPKTLPKFCPGILLQICINLMTNAVDALQSNKNRCLDISAQQLQDMLEIRFSDNGCGLPQNNIGQIFQPFYSTKAHGMGLGLAICRDIVEKHHGRMDAQNRPGGGAIFTVHLPLEHLL